MTDEFQIEAATTKFITELFYAGMTLKAWSDLDRQAAKVLGTSLGFNDQEFAAVLRAVGTEAMRRADALDKNVSH